MKNLTSALYISSQCSTEDKIGSAVRELAELGFRNIELTGGTRFYDGIEGELNRLRKEYSLSYLIHNYFPPPKDDFVINTASRKSEIREKTLALVKEAIRMAQVFDKNLYTIHPGFITEMLPELKEGFFVKDTSSVSSKEDFFKMLELLSEKVIPSNFKVGVENLGIKTADDKFSFLCDKDDIGQFLEYFKKDSSLGILLDLSHLNITSNIMRFDKDSMLDGIVNDYGNKIFAFHLSENNGRIDSHDVLPVDSWQLKFLMKHRKIFNGIPMVFEWHDAANKETYERFKEIEILMGGNNDKYFQ